MNFMRKILPKLCLGALMIVCFVVSFKTVAKANSNSVNITVSKWYSDDYEVGYWSDSPTVFISNLSTSFNIVSYVNSAVSKWSSAGIPSTITSSPTYASIKFYGGVQSQLFAIGFAYDPSYLGLTTYDSYTVAGTVNYSRPLWKLTSVSTSICVSNYTNLYATAALHEYGHSLGWIGHSTTSSSDVMSSKIDIVADETPVAKETLTVNDITHLTQIYNAIN